MRKIICCLLSVVAFNGACSAADLQPAGLPVAARQPQRPIGLTIAPFPEDAVYGAPFDSSIVDELLRSTAQVPEGGILVSVDHCHFLENGNSWKPIFTKLLSMGPGGMELDMLVDIDPKTGKTKEGLIVFRNTGRTRYFTEAWNAAKPLKPGEDRDGHTNIFSWLIAQFRAKHNLQVDTFAWEANLPVTWHERIPQAPASNALAPVTWHEGILPASVDNIPLFILPFFDPILIKAALIMNPANLVVLDSRCLEINGESWAPLLNKLGMGYDMLVDEDAETKDDKGHKLVRDGFLIMNNNKQTRAFVDSWIKEEPTFVSQDRGGHLSAFSWLLTEYRRNEGFMYATLAWDDSLPATWHEPVSPPHAAAAADQEVKSDDEEEDDGVELGEDDIEGAQPGENPNNKNGYGMLDPRRLIWGNGGNGDAASK
ncbi:MAG: hypothetical protein WCG04_00715 [Alphaproteobacteria bacterium]